MSTSALPSSSAPSHKAPSNVDDLRKWLQEQVKQLAFAQLISAVVALVTRLSALNSELTKQLANLRRARPRSERLQALERQLLLPWATSAAANDDGSSPPAPDGNGESTAPKPKRPRKGKHPGRQPFPANLERITQYNGVPPELRRCPKCGIEMGRLGHTHCEYLDVIPARVVVVRRTDETLKCRLDATIVSAPPPPRIVERGVLGNRLIIESTADKFLEHQPIERQCLRFARSGVEIAVTVQPAASVEAGRKEASWAGGKGDIARWSRAGVLDGGRGGVRGERGATGGVLRASGASAGLATAVAVSASAGAPRGGAEGQPALPATGGYRGPR